MSPNKLVWQTWQRQCDKLGMIVCDPKKMLLNQDRTDEFVKAIHREHQQQPLELVLVVSRTKRTDRWVEKSLTHNWSEGKKKTLHFIFLAVLAWKSFFCDFQTPRKNNFFSGFCMRPKSKLSFLFQCERTSPKNVGLNIKDKIFAGWKTRPTIFGSLNDKLRRKKLFFAISNHKKSLTFLLKNLVFASFIQLNFPPSPHYHREQ